MCQWMVLLGRVGVYIGCVMVLWMYVWCMFLVGYLPSAAVTALLDGCNHFSRRLHNATRNYIYIYTFPVVVPTFPFHPVLIFIYTLNLYVKFILTIKTLFGKHSSVKRPFHDTTKWQEAVFM